MARDDEFDGMNQNIQIGIGLLVAHFDGGWAVPGGAVVTDTREALAITAKIADTIEALGGRALALRNGPRPKRRP